MKLLIPAQIDLELPPDDEVVVVRYAPDAPLPDEHLDADVLVVWQNTAAALRDAASRCTALRLVQTLAAGPDAVLAAGFPPQVPIASGRSLHDETVTEHTLALVLACVRRLDLLGEAQRERRWDRELDRAQRDPDTAGRYTLAGAAVTVWGYGSIARALAPLLTALGADVVGVARSARVDGGHRVIAESDLAARLAETDLLISLLPHTPATDSALDATRFAQLKPGAAFVNVGRGGTVDEDALVEALVTGRLRCAAVDVTRTEPLPPDSPLWSTPNLLITPHVAGNRPRGAAELLQRNLSALRAGTPLVNLVER